MNCLICQWRDDFELEEEEEEILRTQSSIAKKFQWKQQKEKQKLTVSLGGVEDLSAHRGHQLGGQTGRQLVIVEPGSPAGARLVGLTLPFHQRRVGNARAEALVHVVRGRPAQLHAIVQTLLKLELITGVALLAEGDARGGAGRARRISTHSLFGPSAVGRRFCLLMLLFVGAEERLSTSGYFDAVVVPLAGGPLPGGHVVDGRPITSRG